MSRFAVFTSFILVATLICSVSALPSHQKLQIWFPKYEYHWLRAGTFCKTELNDYWTNNRSRCWATCACAVDCLLDHTSETIKSNMATANVILGLMPGILVLLGPSVAEMSLLSTRYPLFALLLSFASPAINITHLYRAPASPQSLLDTTTSISLSKSHTWTKGLPSWGRTVIRVAEYALAGGMLGNTIQTSLYLDYRTVSGWRCSLMYMPLSWALASSLVHLIGFAAIRFQVRPSPPKSSNNPTSLVISALTWVSRLFVVQFDEWKYVVANGQDGIISEILFFLASAAGILHYIFGVLVFSSLVFVGALDTLPIVARYAASSVVCQAILLFELAGLRADVRR